MLKQPYVYVIEEAVVLWHWFLGSLQNLRVFWLIGLPSFFMVGFMTVANNSYANR